MESAVANGIRDVYASRKCQSGAQARYQQLLEARYQARMLAAEYVQRPGKTFLGEIGKPGRCL